MRLQGWGSEKANHPILAPHLAPSHFSAQSKCVTPPKKSLALNLHLKFPLSQVKYSSVSLFILRPELLSSSCKHINNIVTHW